MTSITSGATQTCRVSATALLAIWRMQLFDGLFFISA